MQQRAAPLEVEPVSRGSIQSSSSHSSHVVLHRFRARRPFVATSASSSPGSRGRAHGRRGRGCLLSICVCPPPPPCPLESKEGFSCLERYLMDIYAAVGQRGEPLISFTDTFPCETASKAGVRALRPKVFSCPSSSAQARPGGSAPVTRGGDGGEVMVKINPQPGCRTRTLAQTHGARSSDDPSWDEKIVL